MMMFFDDLNDSKIILSMTEYVEFGKLKKFEISLGFCSFSEP